ncbi:DUF2236 domain-containing protein [Lacihabitans sp. LS3-19]|uniref:oxygenase MpaB family protein n=1 Tax=Lacihabitans sp. LS3-19 TaxID=2487335 RepID=UPI0020CEF828|nr:oxygenase MpaB family protein [Lacihabitans sp. LS3-19]MCP9767104.1 DUF2236 domain-containing protein [Lacihabitans sp. LS3-19]
MEHFVDKKSIVREIWGETDYVLFIFGASAGEFALSKSVDWLFYTGKLPNDPIGRLFSTVAYAQKIIFEEKAKAEKTLTDMKNIHVNVENNRGYKIPNWAYQDVLFMLIDYTISAYELLNRTLLYHEKEDIYEVFKRVGEKMGIENLPEDFEEWEILRNQHLEENYAKSALSIQLFDAYKNHLGKLKFRILCEVQKLLLPWQLNVMIFQNQDSKISGILKIYKKVRKNWPFNKIKYLLIPKQYRNQLLSLQKES